MQNSMVIFPFFCFRQEYPFWANLVQKIKIVSLGWNFVPRLIWTCKIQWSGSVFCFDQKYLFWGKFGPKNQNCQFKLKFDTKTNSNTQSSLMIFTFGFQLEILAKFGAKIQHCKFNLNLVATIICKIYLEFTRFHRKSCFEAKV